MSFHIGKCDYFIGPGMASYAGYCLLVDERGDVSRYEDDDDQSILYPCFDVLRERDVDGKERVQQRLLNELDDVQGDGIWPEDES